MSNQEKLSPEESACLESVRNSPELDKRNIFETTCKALSKHSREVVLSLLLSTGIVNAKETTNYSQFEQFGITQTIPTQEIPADLRQGVIQVQEEFNRLKNEGKITDLLMSVELVGASASEIANDLSLAPRKTLEEILGVKDYRFIAYKRDGKWIIDPKEIDENNFDFNNVGFNANLYKHIIEKLFDTSDVEMWLRSGYEKRELTPEELQKYKENMEWTKKRWLNKISELMNLIKEGKMSADVFYEGQELFIKGVQSLSIEPSREAYRRLFVYSMTLAYYENLSQEEKLKKIDGLVSEFLTSNIGEYMQLTNKDFKMVKLGFGNPDGYVLAEYGLPSSNDIKSSEILGKYSFYENIVLKPDNLLIGDSLLEELELKRLDKELKRVLEESQMAKEELERALEELQMAKEELQMAKEELKRAKEELSNLIRINELSLKANSLYLNVSFNIKKLQQTKDKTLLPVIQNQIKELNIIYNEIINININIKNENGLSLISLVKYIYEDARTQYSKIN